MPYMYILECADGSYYTGSTWNLEKRLWEHQNGQGANHTAKHLPVKLVYCEEGDSIEAAYQREKQIQGWSRKKKQALMAGDDNALHKLAECGNNSHFRNDGISLRLRSGNGARPLSEARSLSEAEGSEAEGVTESDIRNLGQKNTTMAALALTNNADLTTLNTLALPAHAAHLVRITDAAQLPALIDDPRWHNTPRFVLGGGSNIVLTGDFNGLILHMAIGGRRLAAEDADAWYVAAGAGENWHDFVDWALAQGWPGLENLALIPGTVGAAPIQNIGAYGLEVAERFHSLTACDMASGETVRFDRNACHFGYRDSVFKQEGWHRDGRFVITDVTFRLPKVWQPLTRYADIPAELNARSIKQADARQIADAVIAIRRRKLPDPAQIPNAGSFFHNPVVDALSAEKLAASFPALPRYPQPDGRVKLAAGWLIEQAGWKGKDLGPVGMYGKQALVLVNHGGACGADVVALAKAVTEDVRQQFAVELTPEPIFLG